MLEKDVRVIPSLPSHLVIHFRFQLSFSNGEVIQMWLARLMGSLGETSHKDFAVSDGCCQLVELHRKESATNGATPFSIRIFGQLFIDPLYSKTGGRGRFWRDQSSQWGQQAQQVSDLSNAVGILRCQPTSLSGRAKTN